MLKRKHATAALPLLKRWEGLRLEAYRDGGGVWTIGYGTTAEAGLGIVPRPGLRITEAEAEDLLLRGVEKFAGEIAGGFARAPGINQGAAFLSLAYNIGAPQFLDSTALRLFNAGDIEGAADALTLWKYDNGKVVQGLVNRRAAERTLFLTPDPAPVAAVTGGLARAFRAILEAVAGVVLRKAP